LQSRGLSEVELSDVGADLNDQELDRLLEALEKRVNLQVKPLADRQIEILNKLDQGITRQNRAEISIALQEKDLTRFREELNRGLAAVRREMKDRRQIWVALASSLPGLIAIFLVYYLRG
jgi:hypothetical protein